MSSSYCCNLKSILYSWSLSAGSPSSLSPRWRNLSLLLRGNPQLEQPPWFPGLCLFLDRQKTGDCVCACSVCRLLTRRLRARFDRNIPPWPLRNSWTISHHRHVQCFQCLKRVGVWGSCDLSCGWTICSRSSTSVFRENIQQVLRATGPIVLALPW